MIKHSRKFKHQGKVIFYLHKFKYKALRVLRTCKYCRELMLTSYYKLARGHKFCCSKCAYKAQVKKRETKQCLFCGKNFPHFRISRDEKFCSVKCAGAYNGFQRKGKVRGPYTQKTYRAIAEEKLKRKLCKGEVVHHVDGNHYNNLPENIVVFNSMSEHQKAHGSLNKLIAQLMELKVIGYKNGCYFVQKPFNAEVKSIIQTDTSAS